MGIIKLFHNQSSVVKKKSMVYDTDRMQVHPRDKKKEGPIGGIRHGTYHGEHMYQWPMALLLDGSPSLTVCRNCQQSEYALLGCTFEHPENFSKISRSVIMVYYHLFFPLMLTHCANIM